MVRTDCERVYRDGRVSAATNAKPRVLIGRRTLRVGSEGVATLVLRCPAAVAQRCRGRVTLTVAGQSLSSAEYTMPAGDNEGVRLRVRAARLAALRRSHPRGVRVRARIAVRDGAGRRSTRTAQLRLEYR